jgi:hypothetical protein
MIGKWYRGKKDRRGLARRTPPAYCPRVSSTLQPRTLAAQLIIEYMRRTGISQAALARACDVTTGQMRDLISGRPEREGPPALPSLPVAVRIARVTQGTVPVETWDMPPQGAT